MRIIAFYLPQFHEIPENNKAWGKGFTEWVNVKKAKPLFWGHRQPRVPLNNNYYNLLDENVVIQQMQLARQYGLYGFCYYHYWFKGRKVLEKPLEKMLVNKDATFPFCLAWANEAWTKTWHGAKGAKEVLIRQTYGVKKDWEDHYEYLRRYFRHPSYIKIGNKPVLLVYKINKMRHRSEMFECFCEMAKKDGFDGMYLVQMLSDETPISKLRWINATVDFEPARIRNIMRQNRNDMSEKKVRLCEKHPKWNWWNRWICDVLDYKKINQNMLETYHGKNNYRCCFVDYDDSPRRGKKALIFKGSSPKVFGYYLKKQIVATKEEGNDMIFINAWNEWGEGNYLEPDEKYQFQYLEEIRRIILEEL
nr:glycoside hydrolase family 99-like domain-containing protein [uncultured Acetatifactor sp.]